MTTSSRSSPDEPGIRRTLPAARPRSRGRLNTERRSVQPPPPGVRSAREVEHDNEATDTAGHRECDAREPSYGNAAIATQAGTRFHTSGMPARVQGYTFRWSGRREPKKKRGELR